MQKLHLVGFTTDRCALIFSARRGAKSGGFVLEVDKAIADAVAEAFQRAGADAEEPEPAPLPSRPQSALSVRELQARLRAGRSIEEVAAEAGVEPEWVARFAPPVIAEQARMVDAARSATLGRARLGPSALPIGAAVRRNLADRGLELTAEELDTSWSARQLDDRRWVVTLRYRSRGREQTPSWELDTRTGEVTARDRLAADLAFVAGKAKPPAGVAKPVKVPAAEPSPTDRAAARRVAEARKLAAAQLDEAVRAAAQRDAELARRAAAGELRRPAATKAAKAARSAKPAKKPAKAAKAAKTAKTAKTAKKPATTATRAGAANRAAPAARAKPSKPAPPTPAKKRARSTPAKKPARAADPVAAKLAAVRREMEQELTAFQRRRRTARPAPAAAPAPAPRPRASRAPNSTPAAAGGDGRRPLAPAPPPVFRGDVAPAAAGRNGPAPGSPARPPRTRPLRAR